MRRYAEHTKITVTQTIADVQSTLARYSADRFQHMVDGLNNRAIFQFAYQGYTINFGFPLPHQNTPERQRIYRAALLAIKAKLESVASGIESPIQAFMAHVVTAQGQTFFEKARALLPHPEDDDAARPGD
jgi:hypothetical protein